MIGTDNMKNEFDVPLDRNGYAPSILHPSNHYCYLCYRNTGRLERHEVFHGSDRTRSKALGLWVYICHEYHYLVHTGDGTHDRKLKEDAQQIAESYYGWNHDDFRKRFRKSYN